MGCGATLSRERLALISLAAPALLLVVVTMLVPVGWLFWLSFTADDGSLSLEHYRAHARAAVLRAHLSRPPSRSSAAHDRDLHRCSVIRWLTSCRAAAAAANLCLIGVLLPFWTSLLVRTYAWLVLLQRQGLINTWGMELGLWDEPLALVHNLTGTLIGMVHIMLPFLVLPRLRLDARDRPRLPEGGGQSRRRPGPRVLGGILSAVAAGPRWPAALIVFMLCLGFYVTPAVLGGGKVIMVSNRIANDIEMFFNWGAASALGVVLLVLTLLMLVLASRVLRPARPLVRRP